MHDVPPWGCPCGSVRNRVRYTEKDEDGHPIRMRTCLDCGTHWETEERVISRGSWYLRAQRRRDRAKLIRDAKKRKCLICQQTIHVGAYYPHTYTPRHQNALEQRRVLSGRTELARAYRAMWRRRSRMNCGATTLPAAASR